MYVLLQLYLKSLPFVIRQISLVYRIRNKKQLKINTKIDKNCRFKGSSIKIVLAGFQYCFSQQYQIRFTAIPYHTNFSSQKVTNVYSKFIHGTTLKSSITPSLIFLRKYYKNFCTKFKDFFLLLLLLYKINQSTVYLRLL